MGKKPLHHGAERICEFRSSLVSVLLSFPCSEKPGVPSAKEDHEAAFYKDYHKVAEEYDKEFLKKHDEDLNTTLIFVSSTRQSMKDPY